MTRHEFCVRSVKWTLAGETAAFPPLVDMLGEGKVLPPNYRRLRRAANNIRAGRMAHAKRMERWLKTLLRWLEQFTRKGTGNSAGVTAGPVGSK